MSLLQDFREIDMQRRVMGINQVDLCRDAGVSPAVYSILKMDDDHMEAIVGKLQKAIERRKRKSGG